MNNRILEKANEFLSQSVPFALATVVRRERPTSGEPGDKAIITSDGEFLGWIGGSCAQPTVLQEAKKAIADGEPRLVVLTPNLDEEPREGVELYRMTCYSGGTMEIYIEPYLPAPQLLVCGASPAAEALVKIGAAVGFKVDPYRPVRDERKVFRCRRGSCLGSSRKNWEHPRALRGRRDQRKLGRGGHQSDFCHCLPITWVWWPAKKDSSRYLNNSRTMGSRRKNLT